MVDEVLVIGSCEVDIGYRRVFGLRILKIL